MVRSLDPSFPQSHDRPAAEEHVMILHLVFFRWQDGVTDDDVETLSDMLRDMAASLPMLTSYECGANLRVRPSDVDYAVAASVDDEEGLVSYLDSDAHRRVHERMLQRMVRDRSSVQLHITDG